MNSGRTLKVEVREGLEFGTCQCPRWLQFHHCNNYNSSEIGELRSFHLFFLFGLCDSYAKKVTWCNKGLDKMAW